jgi:Zn finger protein HypA/HybF involved in hydrogenase expression
MTTTAATRPTLDASCFECGWSDEVTETQAAELDTCPHCAGRPPMITDLA